MISFQNGNVEIELREKKITTIAMAEMPEGMKCSQIHFILKWMRMCFFEKYLSELWPSIGLRGAQHILSEFQLVFVFFSVQFQLFKILPSVYCSCRFGHSSGPEPEHTIPGKLIVWIK